MIDTGLKCQSEIHLDNQYIFKNMKDWKAKQALYRDEYQWKGEG
jgi:hypothetical protein